MRLLTSLLAASVLTVAAPGLAAETKDSAVTATQTAPALTLERVFASPSLAGPVPRAVKLSPDGRYVTVLRGRPDDRERYDLWGFDRKVGEWRMLVDSKKLSSGRELSEAEKMQRERQRIGDFVNRLKCGATFTIHLVDEGDDRNAAQAADFEKLAGLRLNTLCGVDDHDGRIDRSQRPVGVFREILMPRRVEQVEDNAVFLKRHHR